MTARDGFRFGTSVARSESLGAPRSKNWETILCGAAVSTVNPKIGHCSVSRAKVSTLNSVGVDRSTRVWVTGPYCFMIDAQIPDAGAGPPSRSSNELERLSTTKVSRADQRPVL